MFKPMLAASLDGQLDSIKFPVLATPKIDGIRCVITADGPRTRSLKEIPNRHIRSHLAHLPIGFDGELTVGDKFFDCTSGIMSEAGTPDFKYYVFDLVGPGSYESRVGQLLTHTNQPSFVEYLVPTLCRTQESLVDFYDMWLAKGAEGICFRSPHSPYKFGRSTFREQYLIKWKQFKSEEAYIVGFEELMHNDNEQITNELGLSTRSSRQANLRPSGKLGAFWVRNHLWQPDFKIGTGFDDAQRKRFWETRNTLKGRLVRYKYHAYGCKDAPRSPVFEGFRSPIDL